MVRQLSKRQNNVSVLDPISKEAHERREKGGYAKGVKNLIRTASHGTLYEREAIAQSTRALVIVLDSTIFKLAGDPYNTVRDLIQLNPVALHRLLRNENLRGPFRKIIKYDNSIGGGSPEKRKAYSDAMKFLRGNR